VFAYEVTEEEKSAFTQPTYDFQGSLPALLSRFTVAAPPGWEVRGAMLNHAPIRGQPLRLPSGKLEGDGAGQAFEQSVEVIETVAPAAQYAELLAFFDKIGTSQAAPVVLVH
jgi:hypothetical protein